MVKRRSIVWFMKKDNKQYKGNENCKKMLIY